MKKIFSIAIILFLATTTHAQTENPLKQGMSNTVTLSNGEVIYDLSGEWDAIYEREGFDTQKDIVKITQQGNKFVGIKLIGNEYVGKGDETIKGELEKDGFKSLQVKTGYGWIDSKGKISEKGNKIEIDATMPTVQRNKLYVTLTRK